MIGLAKANSQMIVPILITILAGAAVSPAEPLTYQQQVQDTGALYCPDEVGLADKPPQQLGQDCNLLKHFNQLEADSLASSNQLSNVTQHCACKLSAMQDTWINSFVDQNAATLSSAVQRLIQAAYNEGNKHPVYLWSDIDVTFYGVSIHTATKDYFEQQARNSSKRFSRQLMATLKHDQTWDTIVKFCFYVALDQNKLYRYMENLNRANPFDFMRLISMDQIIETVYQASKACKLLILINFKDYKIRPADATIINVDPGLNIANSIDSDDDNDNNLDLKLRDASASLLRCSNNWNRKAKSGSSLDQLTADCPIMLQDHFTNEWLLNHTTALDRSLAAVKCGCQLLLHNSTWQTIMNDGNVKIMSVALTNYMNQNRIPHFAQSSIMTIHGWFENIMDRFVKSKKNSIKEIIKTLNQQQDSSLPYSQEFEVKARELLRRGCNFIVNNHNKGSKQANQLKLIKYLDNLQLISQDPMFVFHLILQDPNLFKLYALSKMCIPFVK